jgi:TRAP transporter TAXI family solute receptor
LPRLTAGGNRAILEPYGRIFPGTSMSTSDGLTSPGDLSFRGRKRSSFFLVLAAGLLLFAAVVGAAFIILRPTTLRVAVGPSGSDDQQLIQALAQTFASEGGAVRLAIVTTAGPVDSIAALAAGRADLAIARTDETMPDGTMSVAIMRKNVVVLWVPTGPARRAQRKEGKSRIKAIEDLAGHRVGVVGRTPVNVTLFRVILKESGVDPDKVQVTQFANDQVSEMVRDSSVDAFMTVGPLDSKLTIDAILATARQRGEPTFLPIDVSEAIATRHPLYESEEIPGSAFTSSPARPDDTVETVGVNHLLVAPKSLSETTVASLTRQIFAAKPSLARVIPSAAKIEKPDTDKDAALPAHPGAAAYIDGTERSFMDKYSDYIWAAVLLFSVLGSVTAGVRHYIKRDERRLNTLHRERLVTAISQVRKIDSIEELDAMQCEADSILRETLNCYDDGAIEEADLAAYSLVLGQFHHAVADRRAALGGAPATLPRMRAS